MTSNVYQLDSHRPKPKIKVRQLNRDRLVEQFSKAKIFQAEMKVADKIKDQEQRLRALSEAWSKFQGRKHYKLT